MKRYLLPLLAALAMPTAVHPEVTNKNEILYKLNQAVNLSREGKISEARTKCDEIIEFSPDLPDGYFCKGYTLLFANVVIRKI